MSDGGNNGMTRCGAGLCWHVLPVAAQKAALPCSLPLALQEPYDTHAAGGAP